MHIPCEYDPKMKWWIVAILALLFTTIICGGLFADEESDRLARYLKMAKSGRISGELQRQIIADLQYKLEKSQSSKMFVIGKNGKITANKQIFTGKDRTKKSEPIIEQVEQQNHPEDTTNYGVVK